MKPFLSSFVKNFIGCFSGYNFLWHLAAAALTYFFVVSGFDWWYFQSTRNSVLQSFLFPAAVIGGLIPLIAPVLLLAVWLIIKGGRKLTVAIALFQAEILGFIISGLYKAFSGRIQPPLHPLIGIINDSNGFRFGFLRGGIFWGWPSTHTTLAFAMAITLYILYSDRKILKYFFVAYALYIGIGVSTNIHWFSDFVAGAIIGTVIGVTVGQSFLKKSY